MFNTVSSWTPLAFSQQVLDKRANRATRGTSMSTQLKLHEISPSTAAKCKSCTIKSAFMEVVMFSFAAIVLLRCWFSCWFDVLLLVVMGIMALTAQFLSKEQFVILFSFRLEHNCRASPTDLPTIPDWLTTSEAAAISEWICKRLCSFSQHYHSVNKISF